MIQCLSDYYVKICGMRVCRQLNTDNFNRVPVETYDELERLFTKTHRRGDLVVYFLRKMTEQQEWQVRLRYLLCLFKICRKLSMYEIVAKTRQEIVAPELAKVKGSLTSRHLDGGENTSRKLFQHIVQPLYHYLVRVGECQYVYLQFLRGSLQHPITDMFKVCNLLLLLFDMRQACRLVLKNFVNVQILEELVETIYDQIVMLYCQMKRVIEAAIQHAQQLSPMSLLELDVLLREDKTIYTKVCEFSFLFDSFTLPFMKLPPNKLSIEPKNLRKLLKCQQLMNRRKETARKVAESRPARDPQWLLAQYIRQAVYDDQPAIQEEHSSDGKEEERNMTENAKKFKKIYQSDSDGAERDFTVGNLNQTSKGYFHNDLENSMSDGMST